MISLLIECVIIIGISQTSGKVEYAHGCTLIHNQTFHLWYKTAIPQTRKSLSWSHQSRRNAFRHFYSIICDHSCQRARYTCHIGRTIGSSPWNTSFKFKWVQEWQHACWFFIIATGTAQGPLRKYRFNDWCYHNMTEVYWPGSGSIRWGHL